MIYVPVPVKVKPPGLLAITLLTSGVNWSQTPYSIDFINYIYTLDTSISKGFRRNLMKFVNLVKPINKLLVSEAEGGILRRPSLLLGEKPGSKRI